MAPAGEDRATLLCLKCRNQGHLVKDCAVSQWHPETHFSAASKRYPPVTHFDVLNDAIPKDASPCDRCRNLDIPGILRKPLKWTSYSELNTLVSQNRAPLQIIGKVGTIRYLNTCQICRCLFALTPNPYSGDQNVVIFPAWTIFRLEGSVEMDTAAKREYSKCLIVTLLPSSPGLQHVQFSDTITRGDALCLLGDQTLPTLTTLNARIVRTNNVDIALIHSWISTCQQLHHFTCSPGHTEGLGIIRLIDCRNPFEHIVVPYPNEPCDYIALSYVWGQVKQRSFGLGPILARSLPRTIEDAIVLTRELGKRYFWCDFVCIDQFDEEHKMLQISKMADIYRGAYATIVALSGSSSDAGLPRISYDAPKAIQHKFEIDGSELVNLMPALTQLIWTSPWGQRSWTLQEALLSRRCIYFSDWQMHFECNGMQCCESLDESRSWVHQLKRTEDAQHSAIANIGTGCLRFNWSAFNLGRERFLMPYASQVVLYSYRSMTDPRDAINAFSGLLHEWGEDYGMKFHFGLPIKYFQWGLLWTALRSVKRRHGFPSWSWAGWSGPLRHRLPLDLAVTDPLQTYLSVFTISQARLDRIFQSHGTNLFPTLIKTLNDDPLAIAGEKDTGHDVSSLWPATDLLSETTLAVQGIIFRFMPKFCPTRAPNEQLPRPSTGLFFHHLSLDGKACKVALEHSDIAMDARLGTECEFLLVSRERADGWIHHWLLLLDIHSGVAQRITTLRLSVPEKSLSALSATKPRKERVLLV